MKIGKSKRWTFFESQIVFEKIAFNLWRLYKLEKQTYEKEFKNLCSFLERDICEGITFDIKTLSSSNCYMITFYDDYYLNPIFEACLEGNIILSCPKDKVKILYNIIQIAVPRICDKINEDIKQFEESLNQYHSKKPNKENILSILEEELDMVSNAKLNTIADKMMDRF